VPIVSLCGPVRSTGQVLCRKHTTIKTRLLLRLIVPFFCTVFFGMSGCFPDNNVTLDFEQYTVGNRDNAQDSGAWWGENITKIAHYGNKTYTFVIDNSVVPRTAFLYEKTDDQEWIEGKSFVVSRPPNILIDSQGYVQVVGFEPFDSSASMYDGRLFYVKFNTAGAVTGDYTKTYITEDSRSGSPVLSTYATIYCGAAIGKDDQILVAYNNSVQWDTPDTHSLGVRIYDPSSQSWSDETVAENMVSRHAYPFAFVSESYFHVFAIEDDYDTYYESAGPPYDEYPYRYGMVKHFQRPLSGGSWEETTLINFNESKTKEEIWDASLRIVDFHVDSANTIHALIRYTETGDYVPKCFHYTKKESESVWASEEILPEINKTTGLYWSRIWERDDNELFYICYTWGQQIWLSPIKTNTLYTISNLEDQYNQDATPFLSNVRSGTPLSSDIYMVIYSGSYEIKAKSVDVSTLGIEYVLDET